MRIPSDSTEETSNSLNRKGLAIVATLSLLTLGLYPLLRYVQSLVTGKPFSWGLPDSMYTTHTLQVQDDPFLPFEKSDSVTQRQEGAPCAGDPEQIAKTATKFPKKDEDLINSPGR